MASDSDDHKQTTASGLRSIGSEPRPSSTSVAPAPAPSRPRYGPKDVIADKYELVRKLGEGGMGEVWLAHNQTLDIEVAIKLIRGDVATEEMADRLLHEARAAARLGHPAIVRVNDFGKTGRGDPFIVMERLDGEDLASALAKRGTLQPDRAVRTLLPIVHALTVAHTKGIVHRDLKPENIYVAKDDEGHVQPKLVDFGVAKLERQQSTRITQSGALLGSPLYMSPEQARGDDVDHRADIWALGVVLYELIVGRAPFDGKNYNAVLYSIIANAPTPTTDLGIGDGELWSIIERALRKDQDLRWYSMRDFGEALAHWLEDRGIHEDITGASLQATWIQWKKSEDALAGASLPPPDDTGPVDLPPPPRLSIPGLETRTREITVRRKRKVPVLALAAGGALLLAIVIAIAATRTPKPEVTDGMAGAAREEHTPAPIAPAAAAEEPGPVDPAHEQAVEKAVEEALAAEDAPPAAAGNSAAPHPKAPAAAAGHPQISAAKGIYTQDPYRTPPPRPHALKDPF
ncbi:MAG TPA: serine/threonine-protein kinase [Polyangiaceae bacterium]|nr:serine/threonine-protein kinase [Polyangiaceae bacterium]